MPPYFLQQDSKVDCGAACAAIFRRQDQTEPALLGERVKSLARWPRFVVAFGRIFGRTNIVQKRANVIPQHFLIRRKSEIHCDISPLIEF